MQISERFGAQKLSQQLLQVAMVGLALNDLAELEPIDLVVDRDSQLIDLLSLQGKQMH